MTWVKLNSQQLFITYWFYCLHEGPCRVKARKLLTMKHRWLAYPKVQRVDPKPFEPFSTFKHMILVDTAKQVLETSVLKWKSEKHHVFEHKLSPWTPSALPTSEEHACLAELLISQQSKKGRVFLTSDLAQPGTCRCWEVVNINIFLRTTGWLCTVIIRERLRVTKVKKNRNPVF